MAGSFARRLCGVRALGERAASVLLVGLVFVMVAVTFSQVLLRYVFNDPLRWSEELARYVFVWISFLGAYVAYRRGAHLGLDLFSEMLRPTAQVAMRIVAQAVVFVTLVWTISTSGRLVTISMNQASAVLGVPMVYVYAAFLVGAAMIALDILLGWVEGLARGRPSKAGGPGEGG